MNRLLAANAEVLARTDPELARLVSEAVPPADFELLTASSGLPSLKSPSGFLHSRVDPVREAERFIRSESPAEPELGLFFGLGLGYAAEAFARAWPGRPLYVVEASIPELAACLSGRDLGRLLAHPGLRLIAGVEAELAAERFHEVEDLRPRLFRWKPLFERHADYYRTVEARLGQFFSRREINANTLKRFGRLWVRNLARNYRLLWSRPGLLPLAGAFDGLPALVVAGGPSLDGIRGLLPELRKRCLVIAVDTSYSFCRSAGVAPDFLVVADPQYWNTRHLDRQSDDGAMLVSEPSTHPAIFRRFGRRAFISGSVFPLGAFFEAYTGPKGRLGAGGSVATGAWDLARHLGCRPIFMAGLDLGFPGKQTHFRGGFFEERAHCLAGRFKPAEHWSVASLFDADPRYLASNAGGRTLTDRRMLLYKWWFERQHELHPEAETYNLSLHGLAMAGMPYRGPDSLMQLPERRASLDRAAAGLAGLPGSAAGAAGPAEASAELLGLAARMAEIAGQGLELVEEARSSAAAGGRPDLAAFDEIDARLAAIPQREVAGFLIQEANLDIQRSEGKTLAELLDNLHKLYDALKSSAEYHAALFSAAARSDAPAAR